MPDPYKIVINAVSAQPIVLAPQVSSGQKLTILQGPITIVGTQLVPATNSTLGGIIVGSNLSITNNGVLSACIPPQGVTAFNNRTGNVTLTANDVTTVANGIYIADASAVSVPVSYGNDLFYGHYQTKNRGSGFPYVSGGLLLGSNAMVGIANQFDPCNIEFWPGDIFNQMRFRAYNKSIVINNDGFSVETGTANWSWSANTILTQGRGDARYQANGSYLNDVLTNVTTSYGTDSVRGMQKGYGGPNFVAGKLFVGSVGMVGMVSGNETAGVEFMTGGVFNSIRIRQFAHTVILRNTGFEVETGTSNWTWSDNSILTQGRGDARYQNAANNTWANLTGKPTFATVATSGSYTDLANTPNLSLYLTTANASSTYLPSANFSFSNLTGKPTTLSGYGITDGLTGATAAATYLPIANFTYSNLTGKPTLANVATSGNYNDLSNKPASYTLPAATNSTLGGVIVGANLSVSANGTLSANIPAGGGGGFANGDILNGGTF